MDFSLLYCVKEFSLLKDNLVSLFCLPLQFHVRSHCSETNAIFTQGTIVIDVYGVWMKHWSWLVFHVLFFFHNFSLLLSFHLFLFTRPTPFPNHPHPFLYDSLHLCFFTRWFPPSLLFVTVHYFLSITLSISCSFTSSFQSVWTHLPWWFALQLNRRTCCSASNWPERKQLKAPGCEHFAAT